MKPSVDLTKSHESKSNVKDDLNSLPFMELEKQMDVSQDGLSQAETQQIVSNTLNDSSLGFWQAKERP
ncbi:hypothetical protein [Gimesia fumaroli]|nr:hypothetical protein [Gimesia fumaroli]